MIFVAMAVVCPIQKRFDKQIPDTRTTAIAVRDTRCSRDKEAWKATIRKNSIGSSQCWEKRNMTLPYTL